MTTLASSRLARLPWALFGAIALIIGFELALRLTHWPRLMPYDLGLDEYHAVAATLDLGDPADVVFIGSSRTRESIYLPTLEPILSKAAGRPISVANYALGRARTYDYEALARRILREPKKPLMIVCGISERDLARGIDDAFDTAPVFWNLHDWRDAWRRHGNDAVDDLPVVLRNEAGAFWRTIQLRDALRMRSTELALGIAPDALPSPLRGEATIFQRTDRKDRNLGDRPVTPERVTAYVKSLHLDPYPNGQMILSLDNLISACNKADVTLVLYEPPTAQVLHDYLPPGLYARYLELTAAAAERGHTRFVRAGSLSIRLGKYDFREQSHMSKRGAQHFTTTFAQAVLVRTLQHDLSDKQKSKKRKPAVKTS